MSNAWELHSLPLEKASTSQDPEKYVQRRHHRWCCSICVFLLRFRRKPSGLASLFIQMGGFKLGGGKNERSKLLDEIDKTIG